MMMKNMVRVQERKKLTQLNLKDFIMFDFDDDFFLSTKKEFEGEDLGKGLLSTCFKTEEGIAPLSRLVNFEGESFGG